MFMISWLSFVALQWRKSIEIFLPSNITLFTLVSLNTFLKSIKLFFYYAWWLLILSLLSFYYVLQQILAPLAHSYVYYLLPIIFIAITSVIILAIRPSVALKNSRYFIKQFPRIFIHLLLLYIIIFAVAVLTQLLHDIVLVPIIRFVFFPALSYEGSFELFAWGVRAAFPDSLKGIMIGAIFLPIVPFVIFSGYFFLDSHMNYYSLAVSFKSVWNSLKLIFYQLPVMMAINVLLFLFMQTKLMAVHKIINSVVPHSKSDFGSYTFAILIFIFVWLLPIIFSILIASFLSTVYIKRVHEDFDAYFTECK